MKKNYPFKSLMIISASFLLLVVASCKKDKVVTKVTPPTVATPTKLGLYEFDYTSPDPSSPQTIRQLDAAISKIGTQTIDDGLAFDTGSGGMVIDAQDIIPASMITSTGFKFANDSTVVNGITITNQTSMIEYGEDDSTFTKVYGNLAYAPVTLGDEASGNVVIKRLPFFLYYKAINAQGDTVEAHAFDLLGVAPEYDIVFPNNVELQSPFSYFTPGMGLTDGFKMASLGTSNFSVDGNYVAGVVTLGLTAADLSSSSGFVISQLRNFTGEGYIPFVESNVTYGSKTVDDAYIIFDTGTTPFNYILDPSATSASTLLANNTSVKVTTTSGFTDSFTTSAAENATYIEGPSSGANISLLGIDFFLNNEYMIDYTDHKLGVKNN
jgi:hypothetical protein